MSDNRQDVVEKAQTSPIEQERIVIFDTTMRDGEQSPGASMSLEEKLEIAIVLEEMGVDVIEAGFAIASKGDFEAITEVSKVIKNSVICSLARSGFKDIDRANEALVHARRKRIHTFIATSPLHMRHKLQMDPDDVHQAVADSVSRARNYCDDVEWSPEDGTRTNRDFLCRTVETAIKCGARTINIPDTVGYTMPDEFTALIKMLRDRVPNIDKATLSVHCHNDLGLAVANTVSAISAGAEEVQCTINGVGERAGNTPLEEIVMALQVRKDKLDVFSDVDSRLLTNTCDLVSKFTNSPIAKNKPIVGENAFAHCSGMHQHGVLACTENYEIMRPMDIGAKGKGIVIGKYSGKHGVKHILEKSGVSVTDAELGNLMKDIKLLKDNQHIGADDMISMLEKYE